LEAAGHAETGAEDRGAGGATQGGGDRGRLTAGREHAGELTDDDTDRETTGCRRTWPKASGTTKPTSKAPVRRKIGWVFIGFWVIYRLVINSGIRFPFLPTKNFRGGNS
jgi:hypothetical protein